VRALVSMARSMSARLLPVASQRNADVEKAAYEAGAPINRPPHDGMMAFVRSPDHHSIELLAERISAAAVT
jgi:hypothetical protein